NAFWESLAFELPLAEKGNGNVWRRWIDTGLDSPDDIVEWRKAPLIQGYSYRVEPRSVAVLYAEME
ncbi:MAG: glgX 3, partial [Deltaproteobacteria bacterium]|nr:glgX 3 [Deltaproteobacteria bacterium]